MTGRKRERLRRLVLPRDRPYVRDDGCTFFDRPFVVDSGGVKRLALSDGCSVISPIWYWLTGRDLPYVGCCDEHDYAYLGGGSWCDRVEADRRLRLCVIAGGFPAWWAWCMWLAVRIGGSAWLPTPFGWGFGLKRWIWRVWSRLIPEDEYV